MTVPAISSSDPSNGESDVYINKNPTVTFTAALEANTVTEDTVKLFDRTTNSQVPITVNYDSSFKKITLTTDGMLRENTSYRIIFVGDDLKVTIVLSGDGAGDDLATSLITEFSTGDDIYDSDITLVKETDAKTLEGDLFVPSNVKILGTDFTVSGVKPLNHVADLAVDLTGDRTVRFHFTKRLDPSGTPGSWVDIETYPILASGYLGQSGVIQTSATGTGFTLPTGTVTIDGRTLVVTFNRDFPNNAGVTIKLKSNIEDSGGLDYGGGMEYSFTTKLYPNPFPTRSVKREIRAVDGDKVYDDYVSSMIHKNTMFLWEKMGRTLTLNDIPYAGWRWIFFSTILDIIEDQDYEKFLTAGTRKQLGDLNVSVDSLIGRLALKIASAQKNRKTAIDTLYAGWQVQSVVRSDGELGEIDYSRLWYDVQGRFTATFAKYDQPNIPASNTSKSRHSKTNNPWW